MEFLKRRWRWFYAKIRADIAGSLATGGLTTAVLFGLDYFGVATDGQTKVVIASATGWLGGKLAAVIRPETHPAGPAQLPAPAPTPPMIERERVGL
jgi:hypothetical protein